MGKPTDGIGFLAEPSYHQVTLTHVRELITEADVLAQQCNGFMVDGSPLTLDDGRNTLVHMALDRAANLLRHAAEELQDERFRALGWPGV